MDCARPPVGVTTGHGEGHHGAAWRLGIFEPMGEHVGPHVMDGPHRKIPRPRELRAKALPTSNDPCRPGPRVGHPLDVVQGAACLFQRPLEDRQDVPLVGTGREFRDHAAVLAWMCCAAVNWARKTLPRITAMLVSSRELSMPSIRRGGIGNVVSMVCSIATPLCGVASFLLRSSQSDDERAHSTLHFTRYAALQGGAMACLGRRGPLHRPQPAPLSRHARGTTLGDPAGGDAPRPAAPAAKTTASVWAGSASAAIRLAFPQDVRWSLKEGQPDDALVDIGSLEIQPTGWTLQSWNRIHLDGVHVHAGLSDWIQTLSSGQDGAGDEANIALLRSTDSTSRTSAWMHRQRGHRGSLLHRGSHRSRGGRPLLGWRCSDLEPIDGGRRGRRPMGRCADRLGHELERIS